MGIASQSISVTSPAPARPRFYARENVQWAFFFTGLFVLRVLAARSVQLDSDEPQHLHVVWAWANGLLQYRDVFDNHAPFFQMLCAPLFRLFGERADIYFPMRLAMLPLFAVCLWCVYKMGTTIATPRIAIWTALFAGFEPTFFFKSNEFRTDDLWAALWLLGLVLLVCRPLNKARAFWFGVVLGMCFSTSLKTVLLTVTLLGAGSVVVAFRIAFRQPLDVRKHCAHAALALLGAVIVPGALILFFAWHHALREMYYGTVQHNVVPGLKRWGHFRAHLLWFPCSIPPLLAATYFLFRHSASAAIASRRALLLISPIFYITALYSYWPDITVEDFIPFVPLAALIVVPTAFALGRWIEVRTRISLRALPVMVAVLEAACLCKMRPWHKRAQYDMKWFADVLALTKPGEYVMDAKAGAIFRPRPYYYVIETISRMRLSKGLLVDNRAERMAATRTAIANTNGLTGFSHDFIDENYIDISPGENLCIAGKMLTPKEPGGREYDFNVAIPQRYTMWDAAGFVPGTLDGTPLVKDRDLAVGAHVFMRDSGTGRIALYWSRAAEKGYLPPFNASRK